MSVRNQYGANVTARTLDYEVFDADNHMYETPEALTKFVPERYAKVIEYVEVNGRTKIAVKGTVSEYIPNPTFDVVARPGAQEAYFRDGNPEGRSYRELVGEPMRSIRPKRWMMRTGFQWMS